MVQIEYNISRSNPQRTNLACGTSGIPPIFAAKGSKIDSLRSSGDSDPANTTLYKKAAIVIEGPTTHHSTCLGRLEVRRLPVTAYAKMIRNHRMS